MACDIYGYPEETIGAEKLSKRAEQIAEKATMCVSGLSSLDQTIVITDVATRIFAASVIPMPKDGRERMIKLFVEEVRSIIEEHEKRMH